VVAGVAFMLLTVVLVDERPAAAARALYKLEREK
jgi:hypothetical protein